MADETRKIDWVAQVSIETDYIVGVHDPSCCMQVGKGAEWLFDFWFGSEILTANIDFAPYATKKFVVDEINRVIAIVNMETEAKIQALKDELVPRIDANELDISALKKRVAANEAGIVSLKAEDVKIWEELLKLKNADKVDIAALIKADQDTNIRIDNLITRLGNLILNYNNRFNGLDNRVDALEEMLKNYTPPSGGGSSDGDGAGKYISKIVDDYANGEITFKKGIRIGTDANSSISISYVGGALKVDGPLYSTKWISAYGSLSGGQEGGYTPDPGGDSGTTPGGGSGGDQPSTPVDVDSLKGLFILKNQPDTTTGVVTFTNGLKIGDVELVPDGNGTLMVKGNAYATGFLSAYGKAGSGSESGSGDGGDGTIGGNPGGSTGGVDFNLPSDGSLYLDSDNTLRIKDDLFIKKNAVDNTNAKVTFYDGIVIADKNGNSATITYENGAVRIGGSAYTTGWLSAYGKAETSGGQAQTGGLDENAMWEALGTTIDERRIPASFISTNSTLATDGLANSGIPTCEAVLNYITESVSSMITSELTNNSSNYIGNYLTDNKYVFTDGAEWGGKQKPGFIVVTTQNANGVERSAYKVYETFYETENRYDIPTSKGVVEYVTGKIDALDLVNTYAPKGLVDTVDSIQASLASDYYTAEVCDERYIRKNVADSTTGVVTFSSGIKIGNIVIKANQNVLVVESDFHATGEVSAGTN